MNIKHRNYVVEYDDGVNVETFPVRVVTVDTLSAEALAPSLGINDPGRAAIAMNLMWVWRAAIREERIPAKTSWLAFTKACLDWRPADSDDVAGDAPDPEVHVPPTMPGVSPGSSSTSAPTALPDSTSTDGETSQPTPTASSS